MTQPPKPPPGAFNKAKALEAALKARAAAAAKTAQGRGVAATQRSTAAAQEIKRRLSAVEARAAVRPHKQAEHRLASYVLPPAAPVGWLGPLVDQVVAVVENPHTGGFALSLRWSGHQCPVSSSLRADMLRTMLYLQEGRLVWAHIHYPPTDSWRLTVLLAVDDPVFGDS